LFIKEVNLTSVSSGRLIPYFAGNTTVNKSGLKTQKPWEKPFQEEHTLGLAKGLTQKEEL
jgi:hypothetical protein